MAARTVNGVEIAYRRAGDAGPVLTLLHGGFVHSGTWEPHLARLATRTRVLAADLRGYGRSARPRAPWRIEDLAADVAALWDELEIESGYLVGFSQGGLVAIALALAAPDRVRGLGLVSTTGGFEPARRAMWRERADGYGQVELTEDLDQHVAACFTTSFLADRAEMVGWYRRLLADASVTSVRNTMLALADADYGGRLGEVRCPALVVYGSEDPSTGPAHGQALARSLQNAQEVEVAGRSHNLHLEEPDAFVELVLAFVERVESGSAGAPPTRSPDSPAPS